MLLPLTQWTLHGESLPERLFDAPKTMEFSLPGADALGEFADLIGGDMPQEAEKEDGGVPYALSGLIEEDISGELIFTKEIDFGEYSGARALLIFPHLSGSGEVYLGEACIARFGGDHQQFLRQAYDLTGMPCALCVDVSEALRLGRREILRLRFDALRPAGMLGAAFLSVTTRAHLSRVSIQPDALRRTMTVRARVTANKAGRYILRVQAVPGIIGEKMPPARETDLNLDANQTHGMQLTLSVDGPAFAAGKAYEAPALKIQLFAEIAKGKTLLCDDTLLLCGYPGPAPRAYLPLAQADCLNDPKLLLKKLCDMRISAVALPEYAPDALYRALTDAGIAAVQHVGEEIRPLFTRYPCLSLLDAPVDEENLSAEAAVWQMAGSVAFVRAIDRTMTHEEMLFEISGKALDSGAQSVKDTLSWLRAVQIRLRAEAMRQGRYQGALCSAQEIHSADVQEALSAAFAPVHLSALPLSGAWWTGTHFSASMEVFMDGQAEDLNACAVLEDDEGHVLARFDAPVKRSGYLGVIEAQLPDKTCVLSLRLTLVRDGETIEECVLPVYVGERGPLEAAF